MNILDVVDRVVKWRTPVGEMVGVIIEICPEKGNPLAIRPVGRLAGMRLTDIINN